MQNGLVDTHYDTVPCSMILAAAQQWKDKINKIIF